jgi:hypothetical protein
VVGTPGSLLFDSRRQHAKLLYYRWVKLYSREWEASSRGGVRMRLYSQMGCKISTKISSLFYFLVIISGLEHSDGKANLLKSK